MIALWIAFALLLVPALWLLVLPLRRAGAVARALADDEASDRTERQNVAVYRRRLASSRPPATAARSMRRASTRTASSSSAACSTTPRPRPARR